MADAANPAENRTVHLVSQEGESFDVPLHVARMSELVKTMIDEDQDDEEAQEIPLPNVKSSILAKVIEFCHHYRQEPMNEIEKVGISWCWPASPLNRLEFSAFLPRKKASATLTPPSLSPAPPTAS